MNIIKDAFSLLLYGVVLGLSLALLDYITKAFEVPRELLISVSIALILFSVLVFKKQDIPKENRTGLVIFISCSIGLSIAIDRYMINFFEYNVFWMAAAYSPVPLYILIITKKNDTNS